MKKIISFALITVLVLTLVSCNKQETINQNARNFVSGRGDYACDLLSARLQFKIRKQIAEIHVDEQS